MITQLINKENVNDMNIEKKLKPYKDDPIKTNLPLMFFSKNAKKPKESTETSIHALQALSHIPLNYPLFLKPY